MIRAGRSALARQVLSFGAIGVVSTSVYAVLYLLLRTVLSAEVSNAAALLMTAIGNTAANRRLTFGVRERRNMGRDHLGGLAAFGAALTITSSAVLLLHGAWPQAPHLVELATLVAANGVATIVRFVMLRTWIVRGQRPSPTAVTTRKALP